MATINPYVNFEGKTEEAFNFYKSVFGGSFTSLVRFKDTPQGDHLTSDEKEQIMHVSLPVGKENVLMGTDALKSMGHTLTFGNNFMISITAESEAEADRMFNGLSAGGSVEVPIGKAFWGAYFGMFTDKFGIKWMVNYDYNKN